MQINKIISSCVLLGALVMAPTLSAQVQVPAPSLQKQQLADITGSSQFLPADFKAYATKLAQIHKAYEGGAVDGSQYWTRDETRRRVDAAARVIGNYPAIMGNQLTPLPYAYYVVPPLSDLMRLADQYPSDGQFKGHVNIIAAQDEYEGASFQFYGFENLQNVAIDVTDLKAADGSTFSKDNLDLKVVKVWYQNGNGWYSYFADPGLALVPELMVHDENLIRVSTKPGEQGNFARVWAEGKKGDVSASTELWISSPGNIRARFNPYEAGFVDADTIQPVSIVAGDFKQFMLTAHVTKDTKPGVYKGSIRITPPGRGTSEIPVSLRVLPFELPMPASYHDTNKKMIISLMGSWPNMRANHPALVPILKNQRAHNILHTAPGINIKKPEEAQQYVAAFKEAGFVQDTIVHRHGLPSIGRMARAPMTYQELMGYEDVIKQWVNFYDKNFGHHNVFTGIGDEQSAQWTMNVRPLWKLLNKHGMKSQIAGHDHIFTKGGYLLNLHQQAGSPESEHNAMQHNDVGHGYVAFYAGQHNGAENPSFSRRQHGMLGYLSGYTAVHNYQFAFGSWNDLDSNLYKPMMVAYPISNGLVDTLQWEGFREGIDDMRYATVLLTLAREAAASDDLDRTYAGRKVLLWFSGLDGKSMDQDQVRLEMVNQILALQKFKAGS